MYKGMESFYDYHLYFTPENPKFREFKSAALLKQNDVVAAWNVVAGGLKYTPRDMKVNMLAAQCMAMLKDDKMALYYLKEARWNCYIGQKYILDKFQTELLGMDVEKEFSDINDKTSKRNRKERETVISLHKYLYGT